MSTGSGSFCSDNFSRRMRIPEKLQIVKPMEGSDTLRQWQSLATPHLGRILDPRPGIQIKGEVGLDVFEEDPYSISDYEEDDNFSPAFIKCLENTSSTYTFTVSKIAHPSDYYGIRTAVCTTVASVSSNTTSFTVNMMPNPSDAVIASPETVLPDVCLSSSATARNHAPWTPPRLDRCTSTFSMSAALAHTLGERGTSLEDDSSNEDTTKQSSGSSWWSKFGFQKRFQSIVTETMCESTRSQTESLYSKSGDSATESSGDGLKLSERIEKLGLDRMSPKRSRSNVKRDPVDVGLNTIISIKRSPRNSVSAANKSNAKQLDLEQGVVSRQYSSLNLKGRGQMSLLGVIGRNFVDASASDEKVKPENFSKTGDILLACATFQGKDATENEKTDIASNVGESVSSAIAIPKILVISESASAANVDFSLPTDFSMSFSLQLPTARPMSVSSNSSWSSSLRGITVDTCSSSSSLQNGPIVHARVSFANQVSKEPMN